MTQSMILIGAFLVVLVCLPFAIAWIKKRNNVGASQGGSQLKFVSALAVGPHQRVVTVEAGPEGSRVWLTLGVTSGAIACLHTSQASPAHDGGRSEHNVPPSMLKNA